MTSSMASSTEADLPQVIPLLVDGIAQEIGAERRDMKVTFVADHRHHGLSTWKILKDKVIPDATFTWERPNKLNRPRPYFEISLVSKKLLMTPITVTGECVPKDIKGSGAYTEPGQPALLASWFLWKRSLDFENQACGCYGRAIHDQGCSTPCFCCPVPARHASQPDGPE